MKHIPSYKTVQMDNFFEDIYFYQVANEKGEVWETVASEELEALANVVECEEIGETVNTYKIYYQVNPVIH